MISRLAAVALAFRADVRAEPNVLVFRAESLADDATAPEETIKAAADVLLKRCKHAGLDVVGVELKDDRKAAFGPFTGKNVERNLAIVLDGKVQSAPIIKGRLPGAGIIQGGGVTGFTEREVRDIVAVLQSGVLPGRLIRVGGDGK